MSYAYNKATFRSARASAGAPALLRIYCSLVVMELGLKEYLGLMNTPQNAGHDVPRLLTLFQVQLPATNYSRVMLGVKITQMRGRMSKMYCQGKDGNCQFLPAESYPYLRYVRHDSDWPNSNCADADIDSLGTVVEDVFSFLKRSGVPL